MTWNDSKLKQKLHDILGDDNVTKYYFNNNDNFNNIYYTIKV